MNWIALLLWVLGMVPMYWALDDGSVASAGQDGAGHLAVARLCRRGAGAGVLHRPPEAPCLEERRMKRLTCWAFGHRWTYAEGQTLTDRITVNWPVVWCGRCNPTGRPHA